MQINQRVFTEFGKGTVLKQEDDKGFCADRWLVQLDNPPEHLDWVYKLYGGLYFWTKELQHDKI